MSVLDRLPDRAMVRTLLDAREASFAHKAKQRTGGSSNRYYLTESAADFDWSGRLSTPSPSAPDFGSSIFVLEAAPTSAQVLISDIVPEIFGSSDGVNWYRLRWATVSQNAPYYYYFIQELPSRVEGRARWAITASAQINSWFGFKVQVIANEPISLSVSRLQ